MTDRWDEEAARLHECRLFCDGRGGGYFWTAAQGACTCGGKEKRATITTALRAAYEAGRAEEREACESQCVEALHRGQDVEWVQDQIRARGGKP